MDSLKAHLLIAAPLLEDPNFQRTVVLIAEHSDEGAMGVVLNRPTDVEVADAAAELEELVDAEAVLYEGGPVAPTNVMVIAEFDDADDAALLVAGRVGFLAAGAAEDPAQAGVQRARVFAGHSGWGPGQLENELDREDWIVVPAMGTEVFSADPDELWAQLLERKGGQYALLARMPIDPSLN